jgi:hypothetical protein
MKTLSAAVLAFTAATACAQEPLRQVQTIPLPDVSGRIDHMAVDIKGQRLFVAALGNDTVEIVDLAAGKRVETVRGFQEPQGIAYVPRIDRVYIASGGDGTLKTLDGKSYQTVQTVNFSDDADNVRYDASTKIILIYAGYGKGALGIVDAAINKQVGDIRLDGHPESFQLEKSSGRIFVNVPTARQIAVIDRGKKTVLAKWPVTEAAANFPMALDEPNHRLFVGCRKPASLLVYDTGSGKLVTSVPIVGDTDDLFYDAQRKRIYVSGGEGAITVLAQRDADHYQQIAKIATAAGTRTSLLVPELDRLFLAVPKRANQQCEIRVFQVQ